MPKITVYRDNPILGPYNSRITMYTRTRGIKTLDVDQLNFRELERLYNAEDTIGITVSKGQKT